MNENDEIPMVSDIGMDQFIKTCRKNGINDDITKQLIQISFENAIKEAFERN